MTATGASGGCSCGAIRYHLQQPPLFVNCCHCRWCQRESGSAFVLNAMVETACLELVKGTPERVPTPSASGKGQLVLRCPKCRVALWSHYSGAGERVAFVRGGTLDDPDAHPPGIHIFTTTKQPWVILSPGTPAVPAYYDRAQIWPAASLARYARLMDVPSATAG